uniref:Carbonic anhydrase n=1 Tax=Hucho hucho TaxID=62062 RepID=A0A4W5P8K8_9TELE
IWIFGFVLPSDWLNLSSLQRATAKPTCTLQFFIILATAREDREETTIYLPLGCCRLHIHLTSVCIILYLCSLAIADQPWCHNGCENSPSFWPSLPNSQCGGVRQSPINIDTNQLTFDPSLHNLTFSDITNPHSIKFLTNNGHTVSCVLEEGLMEVRGGGLPHGYTAVMMHFHWGGNSLYHPGSEHTVDSVRYPMEIHLVTLKEGLTMEQAKTDPERIAVFGFFIDVERFPKTLKYRDIYRPVQHLNGRPVYASPGVSVSPLGSVSSGQTSSRGALLPSLLLLLGWG